MTTIVDIDETPHLRGMPRTPSDVAFTDTVKRIQTRRGSRQAYARMEQSGGWETTITDELAAFLTDQTSFFLATANAAGQPYIQHRGGPKGFLRVLDATTLGFADFRGNRQYISIGNLAENAKVHLFLIDYEHRRRIKIWGEATVVEDDPALLAKLSSTGYEGRPERAIVVRLAAWDANCPQHIPQKFDAADVAEALAARDRRIAELEAKLERVATGGAGARGD
jgi:predicted pyridoxine 5'-phosphate oxidase superfamily flavin-nucleotide-binding protein